MSLIASGGELPPLHFSEMGALKKLMREKVLELPGLAFVRNWLSLRAVKEENRRLRSGVSAPGFGVLDPTLLRRRLGKDEADTFFILGSGASAGDLKSAEFQHISSQVSVGVNTWALHSFVPDFYSYEPVAAKDIDQVKILGLLSRKDILAQNPHLLFLRPRNGVEREQLGLVPEGFTERTHIYGRFQPFTRVYPNLQKDLQKIWGRLSRRSPVLLDSGASIVRMAFLGERMGFRKIVFVGVDLHNSEYFWEKNPEYLHRHGLSQWRHRQSDGQHETMSPANRPFVVTDTIFAMRDILAKRGVDLLVASKESLLASVLPIYDFSKAAHDGVRRDQGFSVS